MKKVIGILMTVLTVVGAAFFLTGCHEHTFSKDWSSNAEQHWRQATCKHEERADEAKHSWTVTEETDTDGNSVYKCSVCGYVHQHTFNSEKYEYNGRGHWHPATCGHDEARGAYAEHDVDASNFCTECKCDVTKEDTCRVAFAYVKVDDEGQPEVDADGNTTQVGVTYTSVEKYGSLPIDTVNGGELYAGDVISFTVKKSVFCEYTDGSNVPFVEVYYDDGGKVTKAEPEPDASGVYTVKIIADTVISVANVQTLANTIKGSGTQQDPFTINSVIDWLFFAQLINDKTFYNFQYNIAFWRLDADLDFEGESIYVIGDGYTTESSVFCGNFDGNGHKLSNFVLENNVYDAIGSYSTYIGVFGVISGYEGVESVIRNLTVENVTVNAVAAEDSVVSAGVLVGYGLGVNIVNCTVKNCKINVEADDMYMSFAGGVVGYMQSALSDNGIVFFSSVSYTNAQNVEIKGAGMLYDAGLIAGRVVSYNEQVTSFIYNCYSSGVISGAVRVGGIAADLQRYSSVQNSYSTATLSAHSVYTDAVIEKFDGTVLDDRYSYAGGIVGYAENDTVVTGSFFKGQTSATAAAGKSYAKIGHIVAGSSEAGYADYYAQPAAVFGNADQAAQINEEYLKNELKWNDADWLFEGEYPTVNPNTQQNQFNVYISIGGSVVETVTVKNQYLPMSYLYIIGESNGSFGEDVTGIKKYFKEQGSNASTYGYFFDEALTEKVPVGYLPMADVTLYAGYADISSIAGVYFIGKNGKNVKLTVKEDGSYLYEEGAVVFEGKIEYDGRVLAFDNACFARLSDTATQIQQAYYYKFWAEVSAEGNLNIFDCDEIYSVSSENEEQSSSFTAMARFYAKGDPLVAVAEENIKVIGNFYYKDGNNTHKFFFGNDGTGTYQYDGVSGSLTSAFTTQQNGAGGLELTVSSNGRLYLVSFEGGVISSITDPRGNVFEVNAIDGFIGKWEKQATSHKIYTFDGMGGWTYEHYTYLVSEGNASAVKQLFEEDCGAYTLDASGKQLTLTRSNGTVVTAILKEDGSIGISEDGREVEVDFSGINSYKGNWYTAGNKVVRYSLTLGGLDQSGVGDALLRSSESVGEELKYTAASETTLYLYKRDIVYGILTYDVKIGRLNALFYDSYTGATSISQQFYLYDDFAGSWVSDIEGIEFLSFNGFGLYNVTDSTGDTLAVEGTVDIKGRSVGYKVDRSSGTASFTYDGVSYTLSYNEYTNEIAVSYDGKTGLIAKADEYADITFIDDNGTTYSFDGRGYFENGGVITIGDQTASYKIDASGKIVISGAVSATISPVKYPQDKVTGYLLNESISLAIDNPFTGTWAISDGASALIEIDNMYFLPEEDGSVQISGKYAGNPVTFIYTGEDYITFEGTDGKHYLVNTLGGKKPVMILSDNADINDEDAELALVVHADNMYGTWEGSEGMDFYFNGCGDSYYVEGAVYYRERETGSATAFKYRIVKGVVTIYSEGEVIGTFVECDSSDEEAYRQGDRYYKFVPAE